MDHTETLKILSVIKVAYPQFYSKMSPKDANATVALWEEMFAEDAYEVVGAAVKSVIATDATGYPPSIGAIKQMINRFKNPETDTSASAWSAVRDAVSHSILYSEREFEKLPPIAKKVVGGASQLKDWAIMDIEEFNTVVQSNFLRTYRAMEKQQNEIAALPPAGREMMQLLCSPGMHLLKDLNDEF